MLVSANDFKVVSEFSFTSVRKPPGTESKKCQWIGKILLWEMIFENKPDQYVL